MESAFVEMLIDLATPAECYARGTIHAVNTRDADEWTRRGIATPTKTPPLYYRKLLDRLDIGRDSRALFLPFVGEFGHMVMTHIRTVHFNRAKEKIVCCRQGEQVLFPSATECVTNWTDPISDIKRIGSQRSQDFDWSNIISRYPYHAVVPAGDLSTIQELICINPQERIPFKPKRRGLSADVVFGIRRRSFAQEKNWPHWQDVADGISARGYTYAVVGHHATSENLVGQKHHSGDHDTDAAIELIRNCRLYVGTDTGVSHLAAEIESAHDGVWLPPG